MEKVQNMQIEERSLAVAQASKGIKPLRAEVSAHNPDRAMQGDVYLPGWDAVIATEVPQFYASLKALSTKSSISKHLHLG